MRDCKSSLEAELRARNAELESLRSKLESAKSTQGSLDRQKEIAKVLKRELKHAAGMISQLEASHQKQVSILQKKRTSAPLD